MNIWRMVCSLVLAAFSAILLPVLSHAQSLRQVSPNFIDTDVRRVVHVLAEITETDVVIQAGVEGNVTFRSSEPMTPDEFRRVMIAHLLELGYEVSDRDGVLQIGPRDQ